MLTDRGIDLINLIVFALLIFIGVISFQDIILSLYSSQNEFNLFKTKLTQILNTGSVLNANEIDE